MSKCTSVTIEVFKGTTVRSPNFFDIEEVATPGNTIADIEAGILDGTYTPVDPATYNYAGMVRAGYNQASVYSLAMDITTITIEGTPSNGGSNTYDVVTFKIPPSITESWANKEHTLLFDIKRTLGTDNTEVDIWVAGTLQVLPVITE